MKKILNEFKQFILRGNIVDMAVGVIIGSAFGAIVTALTNKIIMPLVNLIVWACTGDSEGINLITVLNKQDYLVEVDGVATINPKCIYIDWGAFIEAIINFLLIAIVLFVIVKIANTIAAKKKAMAEELKAKKAAKEAEGNPVAEEPVVEEAPAPDPVVVLLEEIRDQLKANKASDKAE